MAQNITADVFEGGNANCNYDRNPDQCPLCHHHIEPRRHQAVFLTNRDIVQILYRCPREACSRLFIGTFRLSHGVHRLSVCQPVYAQKANFSIEIEDASPSFIEIYNQALAAESHELNEMAGIGLRKALEFLIKDYLIAEKPENEEEIKKKLLGKVIKEYVDDPRLKTSAELAAWLGNDETHYVRKWVDHDIEDLKDLIRLSVNWIESNLIQRKLKQSMKPPSAEATDIN